MIATLIWISVFVVTTTLGVIGFTLNANTPLQVGPLPAIFFAIALIALIVVIARVAT